MKLLIATGIFPPDIGGPATYSKILAEELIKRGHEVNIVTYADTTVSSPRRRGSSISDSGFPTPPSPRLWRAGKSGMTVKSVSRQVPKGIRHLVYFWQVLKNGVHADIIYAQDAVSAGFPAVLASCILRKRFFLKVVGDHAWEQGMQRFGVKDLLDDFLGKRYGFRVWLLRTMQKFTAKRASSIIVPSEYLKSVVEHWEVSGKKIVVIPNAVSALDPVISKDEARAKLGLHGFIILSVGRLVPWKGFSLLVELMPRLIQKIPDVKLVIIGNGPEEKYLVSRISYLSLENSVFLTGGVSKERLALYLSASDVFCLNTGYEGFSHQLIESMAAGIPIITTDAGGNREVVRNGENTLVARYNDIMDWEEKILRLHADKELQARLAKQNRDVIQTYSVETMIKKTEKLLLTP